MAWAAWARSTARATPSSAATSPSRSCPGSSRAILIGWRGSSARRASWPPSIIHTSARSMDWKTLTACGRWCSSWSTARRWPIESRADPIAVKDALKIARQITEALDAAHERGIVHRDLKPANIKITPDGVVKVLDFGLAKAVSGNAATADLTQSPTVTVGGTREGVILGTAAYMSPEQARGQAVDKRTDIWAFGCVLYEMLTGGLAFSGATVIRYHRRDPRARTRLDRAASRCTGGCAPSAAPLSGKESEAAAARHRRCPARRVGRDADRRRRSLADPFTRGGGPGHCTRRVRHGPAGSRGLLRWLWP